LIVGDEAFREIGWAHVEQLRTDGVTFLVGGQNARVMERFCTRGIVLAEGGVAFDGSVAGAIELVGRGSLQDEEEETLDEGTDVLDADRDEWRAD